MHEPNTLSPLFPALAEIPAEHRLPVPLQQKDLLVDGELVPWHGPVQRVFSPVGIRNDKGKVEPFELGSVPAPSEAEAMGALQAAIAAYDNGRGTWPIMTVAGRIKAMQNFVRAMLSVRDEVVRLLMWEIGKSFADSQREFDRTVDYIQATIEELRNRDNDNSRFLIAEGTIGQIRRTPLGVVLCMAPYNYPLNETFATLIPALIMGNTVVFKPPKWGVLLFSPLLTAFRDAFPKGVINFVYGESQKVIPPLMKSGKIDVLTLIGSSHVADELKKMHPKVNRLRAVLGLDAKNAAIILPDADIGLAVKECLAGALSFNGQRCTALKMLIVHKEIVDEFLARFIEALQSLKIGMPWEPGVAITPLPDINKALHMQALADDAKAHGARILNEHGGEHDATLFRPAIVYPVDSSMRLYREEQFGPIIPVMSYDQIETALDYVATSEHGQQVSIFSSDAKTIGELVDRLVNQVCRVNINCQCQRGPDIFPFTGRKDSAEGTLSVTDALRSFSIRSMVALKQTDASKQLLNDIVTSHDSNFINTGFIL